VLAVLSTACDPTFEQILLRIAQSAIGIWGWHQRVRIGRVDPIDQLAFGRIAWSDRVAYDRRFPVIEPQIGLPFVGVLSVAVKAILREDGTDVSIEVDRPLVLGIDSLLRC
jgi:hypothetical protein